MYAVFLSTFILNSKERVLEGVELDTCPLTLGAIVQTVAIPNGGTSICFIRLQVLQSVQLATTGDVFSVEVCRWTPTLR